MSKNLRILVVGGVAAGPAAAARAARVNPDATVVLYEKSQYISYGTCDLPYFISGEITDADALIMYSPSQFQQEKNVQVHTHQLVEKIRPVQRKIQARDLSTNTLYEDQYDRLILATGSTAIQPFPELNACPNLFTLKTLGDAKRLKNYLTAYQPRHAVILGAGFIGLEMTEALRRIGLQVTLLHRDEWPAPGFEPEIRQLLAKKMSDMGVTCLGNSEVTGFLTDAGRIGVVQTLTASHKADLVLLAWGFAPNTALAKTAGIRLGTSGGIIVDEHLRTSCDGIYACGDCVELKHRLTNRPVWLPLASIAAKTARVAADNAAGRRAVYKGTVGTLGFRFFDLEVARTGLDSAAAGQAGFTPISRTIDSRSHVPLLPGAEKITVTLLADRHSGQLLGGNIIGKAGAALRINPIAIALQQKMTVADFAQADLIYTPPFAPLWDPLLRCANALLKATNTKI